MAKKRTREEIEADLKKAEHRLHEIQTKGNAVISEYDLMFGYDANFYLNVCTLPANHVSYYKNELEEHLKLEIVKGQQLSLF